MNDVVLRLSLFSFTLLFFSLLEVFFSYRKRRQSRSLRWFDNVLMIVVSSLLLRLFLPSGLAYFSLLTEDENIGLFNLLSLNSLFELVISILLLDLLIYFQHLLSHKIGFFWRFHQVHHTDLDLDATSALRFHPIEILASAFYKIFFIIVLGISVEAILLFEIILNMSALFNHANLSLPPKVDRCLRLLLVTPQMHVIHHSIEKYESDKNFGFCLSCWDRLFSTYMNAFQSKGEIGQKNFMLTNKMNLSFLLKMPFKRLR